MTKRKEPVRQIKNQFMDSVIWECFDFRRDDIVIGGYARSGAPRLQQIIGQLIFNGDEHIEAACLSPWIERRSSDQYQKLTSLDAQNQRRFMKTRLPADALPLDPDVKYLYIARDGRDVLQSLHGHHSLFDEYFEQNDQKKTDDAHTNVRSAPESMRDYFHDWLDKDGDPFWSYWDNIRSWWAVKDEPNVMLIHFNDLDTDLPGQIRKIAKFLNIPIQERNWGKIVEQCKSDYIDANVEKVTPRHNGLFKANGKTFVSREEGDSWQDVLTAQDIKKYQTLAQRKLGGDCASWLAGGGKANKNHDITFKP